MSNKTVLPSFTELGTMCAQLKKVLYESDDTTHEMTIFRRCFMDGVGQLLYANKTFTEAFNSESHKIHNDNYQNLSQ